MTQHRRMTFNQARDVLQHAIDFLQQIEQQLAAIANEPMGEREQLLLASFQSEQGELRESLGSYLEDAPDAVLNTFVQITAELPVELPAPETPLTTLSITRWLEGQNAVLSGLFREVAGTAPPEAVKAAFSNLDEKLAAHNRKLSKEYGRFEDL